MNNNARRSEQQDILNTHATHVQGEHVGIEDELEKQLIPILETLAIQQSNDGTWWADDWTYDVTEPVEKLLQLITRYGLEQRQDELDHIKTDIELWDGMDAPLGVTSRITEITKQLEELTR